MKVEFEDPKGALSLKNGKLTMSWRLPFRFSLPKGLVPCLLRLPRKHCEQSFKLLVQNILCVSYANFSSRQNQLIKIRVKTCDD